MRVCIRVFFLCVRMGERTGERAETGDRAGVNTRAYVRVRARTHARARVRGFGVKF